MTGVEFEHGSSKMKSSKRQPFCYSCGPSRRKPPLPKPRPISPVNHDFQLDKNFVFENAITVIKAMPKQPLPKMIDTRVGTNFRLDESGLLPKYIKKPNYGRIPKYLEKRKEEMKESQQMYNEYVAALVKQSSMQQLPDQERKQLLQGLQTNYDHVNHQYLTLSLVLDSCSKRFKKDTLESQLLELDKYIKILQSNSAVFVAH